MENQSINDENKEKGEQRKKFVVNELTNSVITTLPTELSEMLNMVRQQNNTSAKTATNPEISTDIIPEISQVNNVMPVAPKTEPADTVKKTSTEVEQTDNRKKFVENDLTNSVITNLPPELAEMLKAARQSNNEPAKPNIPPPPPPKAPPAAPAPPVNNRPKNIDMTIVETGSVFGIQVNQANRRDVLAVMKDISKINISNPGESIFKYDDLGIVFYFGEGGNLQEITFSYPFEGKTSKGLRIEESVIRAIELYGQPKMKTQAGAIWNKFAVFLKDDIVTTIRLRNS